MIEATATTLSELAAKATEACKNGVAHNLVLTGRFPYAEADGGFVMDYASEASDWQNPVKPDDLWINHGQYIHKHGNGQMFIAQELRNKPDSNRACLSLINMEDLTKSHDDPIPSFMVLQFGFPGSDRRLLLVTAYFRALEVTSFLPVNLSEIALNVRYLKADFPDIEQFELTIIAFKAYSKPNFHRLRKAAIDSVNAVVITYAVVQKNLALIHEWLDSKINVEESVVCLDGLRHLSQAMNMYKSEYNDTALRHLQNALDIMRRLQQTRQSSSHASTISQLNAEICKELTQAKNLLK